MKRRFRTRSEADCLTFGIKCSHFVKDVELFGSFKFFLQYVIFSEVECKYCPYFDLFPLRKSNRGKIVVKYVEYYVKFAIAKLSLQPN